MYVTHLSIPGTHGKWPWKLNHSFEGQRRWYIALTSPRHQFILFSGKLGKSAKLDQRRGVLLTNPNQALWFVGFIAYDDTGRPLPGIVMGRRAFYFWTWHWSWKLVHEQTLLVDGARDWYFGPFAYEVFNDPA